MKDFKQEYEERQNNYEKECQAELKADKKFQLSLTPEQAVIVLEPSHAPENFYCDGEVSHAQGLAMWKGRLKNSGLNPDNVNMIVKYIFG